MTLHSACDVHWISWFIFIYYSISINLIWFDYYLKLMTSKFYFYKNKLKKIFLNHRHLLFKYICLLIIPSLPKFRSDKMIKTFYAHIKFVDKHKGFNRLCAYIIKLWNKLKVRNFQNMKSCLICYYSIYYL